MSEPKSDPVPAELRAIARERGWSAATVAKVARARVPLSELRMWGWMQPEERVDAQLGWHERLRHGDLRGRQATMGDNEAFSELWLNSPERIGDWEILTERSPDAFAQYKLQENVTLSVFAVGDGLVACVAWSRRNVCVAGKRLSVTYGQALRVHDSARRQGYGDQVRRLPWLAAATRPNHTQYDIMRSQNFAVVNWWTKYDPNFFDTTQQNEDSVPGQQISVSQLPARPASGDEAGILEERPLAVFEDRGLDSRLRCSAQRVGADRSEILGEVLVARVRDHEVDTLVVGRDRASQQWLPDRASVGAGDEGDDPRGLMVFELERLG